MPRQKTEASAYLDIYKLVTEKKRLQDEMVGLEQRRDRILSRLEILDAQIAQLETDAQQLRDANLSPNSASAAARPNPRATAHPLESGSFDTLFLEY
jgi:outer membrane murein-binding lipoprotein Lpp